MSCSLTVDNEMTRMMRPLESHNNVYVLDKPWEVSKNISMPKPVVSTISNWLMAEDIVTNEMMNRYNTLPWLA